MTPTPRRSPAGALATGFADVARAPWLIVAAAALTVAMALPFALVLGTRLQASLASQPPVALAETEIDAEWWQEFRRHASGLEATFTPAVLGFAATLDSISGLLDGRQPPLAVIGPLALSIVAWAFLWGGILRRFENGGPIGIRRFVESGFAFLPRFIAIAGLAAAIIIALYLTWHRLLFGPVYGSLSSMTANARDAFFVRVILYLIFVAPLVVIGLVADYARVASVAGSARSLGEALRTAIRFVRGNLGAVVTLYVMAAIILLIVTAVYGSLEVYGGSQVGGWRAIAIGQLYILFRLAMRLVVAASELWLFPRGATPQ